MHARRVLVMVAFAAMAAIGACTSFDASDEMASGAADGSADALVGEGAVVESGGDPRDGGAPGEGGGGDAGPLNLLTNGDFELSCAGGYWKPNESTLTEDTEAHGGKRSCRVCGRNDAGSWSIFQDKSLTLAPGQKYMAEAWVRTPPTGIAANPLTVPLEARKDFNTVVQGVLSAQQDAIPTWTRLTAVITLDDAGGGGTKMEMGTIANNRPGCFLVDDAALYLMP